MKKIRYEQAKILEDIIGKRWKKIPQVNKIEWDTKGVKINDGEITGLGLFQNQLQTLPESIGNLKSLEALTLDNNQLSSLPESIGNLKWLKSLYLSDNQLSSLPESTTELRSLQTLWLERNKLGNLSESMSNLKSLEILNLDKNQLTIIPESIGNLNSLKLLYLSDNQIVTLPESIGKLNSLETLRLDYNQLRNLIESIGNLESLTYLNLAHNNLKILPNSMENLKVLLKIELEGNPLKPQFKKMLEIADGSILRKICEKQKLKIKKEELEKEKPIIEKLIRDMKLSDAILMLKDFKNVAMRYNLSEILSWIDGKIDLCITLGKIESLKKSFPIVEKLIRETRFISAISKLKDIKNVAMRSNLSEILSWVDENLKLCNKMIIKKTVLELGSKYPRLQIAEISEVCSADDVQLIVDTVKDMIQNKEIYAQYFSSTQSVAFDQQANIDEIDKLMSTYKNWEDRKIGKK